MGNRICSGNLKMRSKFDYQWSPTRQQTILKVRHEFRDQFSPVQGLTIDGDGDWLLLTPGISQDDYNRKLLWRSHNKGNDWIQQRADIPLLDDHDGFNYSCLFPLVTRSGRILVTCVRSPWNYGSLPHRLQKPFTGKNRNWVAFGKIRRADLRTPNRVFSTPINGCTWPVRMTAAGPGNPPIFWMFCPCTHRVPVDAATWSKRRMARSFCPFSGPSRRVLPTAGSSAHATSRPPMVEKLGAGPWSWPGATMSGASGMGRLPCCPDAATPGSRWCA